MKNYNNLENEIYDNIVQFIVLDTMVKKMDLMNFNRNLEALEIENIIYTSRGKVLTEKEKIFYGCW